MPPRKPRSYGTTRIVRAGRAGRARPSRAPLVPDLAATDLIAPSDPTSPEIAPATGGPGEPTPTESARELASHQSTTRGHTTRGPTPGASGASRSAHVTEATMIALLRAHCSQTYQLGERTYHRYAWADHVPVSTGLRPERVADFIAMDTAPHPLPSRATGLPSSAEPAEADPAPAPLLHAHEIKVSRGDLLAELRAPTKAATFARYVHHFWLVVPTIDLVRDDLPAEWGLLVGRGTTLRIAVPAPRREPAPLPLPLLAALMRGVQRAGLQHAGEACACHPTR